MKLAFNRPNKTLGGHFRTKAIVKQLYDTHVSYCKLLNKDPMEPEAMKGAVGDVLVSCGFELRRAKTLEQEEIMRLLEAFHGKDIYFA